MKRSKHYATVINAGKTKTKCGHHYAVAVVESNNCTYERPFQFECGKDWEDWEKEQFIYWYFSRPEQTEKYLKMIELNVEKEHCLKLRGGREFGYLDTFDHAHYEQIVKENNLDKTEEEYGYIIN